VTTGPPLYLVSACGSAEEFVAAFRRYADRTGLFVPSTAPLPAGRRGRIALTLKDGGVMIEGEAEILQSSAKPTVLHGRPGMTVKFVEPDEPSRQVIGELEKARLAMKPAPTSIVPRPATIPAQPRPVPPMPSGRIDAANALAECVVIGDPSTLIATANAPRSAMGNLGVPAIPAAPRGKTPSAAPPLTQSAAPTSAASPTSAGSPTSSVPPRPASAAPPSPPAATSAAPDAAKSFAPASSGPSKPFAVASKLTSIGFPAVDKMPAITDSGRFVAPASGDSARVALPARGDSPAARGDSARVAAPAPRADSAHVATPAPRGDSAPVEVPRGDSARVAAPAPRGDSAPIAAPGDAARVAAPAPRGDSAPVAAARGDSAPTPARGDSGKVSNATTLGLQALDRKPDKGLLSTMPGVDAPANKTPTSVPAQNPLLDTKLGHSAPRTDPTPPRFIQAATVPGPGPAKPPVNVHEEQTAIGQAPPQRESNTLAATPLFAPILDDEATAIGAVPKRPTDPMPTTAPKPTPQAIAAAEPQRSDNPRNDAKQPKATSIGFPVQRNPFETQPLGIVPPASPGKFDPYAEPQPPTLPKTQRTAQPAQPRGKNPTTPPLSPRHPTPVAPVPIVRPPAKAAPSIHEDEHTDLATVPTVAASPLALDAAAENPALKTAEHPVQQRSGGMRASEILAAIPAGDWTMSPDELVPHALPAEAKVGAPVPQDPTPAPSTPPKGPPTGDWTISLDPETGWSEPEKVAKAAGASTTGGNPIGAVSSDKPISVVRWDDKPTGIGESKIEIDSTLMEAQKVMPDDDQPARIVGAKPGADSPPPMPPRPGFGMHDQYAAAPYRHSSTSIMGFGPTDPAKRKKMIVMAIAAGALAVGAIVILVLTLGGKDKPSAKATGSDTPREMVAKPEVDAAVAPIGSGSQQGSQQVVVGSGGSAETPKPPVAPIETPVEPPKPTVCKVNIRSTPTGADVYVDKQKLGTTPTAFELPCGTEAKLTLRKKSFPNTNRSFTPVAGKANQVVIKLAKTMFQVKVTSTPAGATITAGGKSLGVTPTTIKLPGFEATALTLTKPGFAAETQRVNPKQNNASHHVTLKKGRSR
jgi:hypothetical protein